MCGIAGAVGLDGPPDPAVVRRVLDATRHRGPDAEGERFRDGVWLGFRRLSVLDLSSRADQPMVDEPSGVALLFNGEIYNYVELREALVARGRSFTSTGDTEVLLQGYLEWGEGLFERCNGMWAVAVDDPAHDGVLLARDRFGEKPLHVTRGAGSSWWFASEAAPLLEVAAGGRRLDLVRALGFLALGDIEDPARSYVDGIVQVPPGCTAILTARGLSVPRPWFRLDEFVLDAWSAGTTDDDAVLEALDRSVRLRLRSDVEVGTSLSGGVDSSAVVASLRAVDPDRTLHAFTASFPGQAIDEWDRAELVGRRFGVTAHRVEPTAPGFVDDLDRLIEHQGGPIESPTVYAQWCVMRSAHEHGVTVLLDGQGADESWGGYPKYVGFTMAEQLGHLRPDEALALLRTWRATGRMPRIDPRQIVGLVAGARARRPLRDAMVALRRRRLGPAFDGVVPLDPQEAHGGPLLARAARADLGRVILPRLLRYADRNSMAWSREMRLPFLDPEVMRLGLGSSWADGLASGWTKASLRRVVARRLPDEIAWRRDKTAYETPDTEWLARPDIAGLVRVAAIDLHRAGVLAAPSSEGLGPWRVLSLARFVDRYGLTP